MHSPLLPFLLAAAVLLLLLRRCVAAVGCGVLEEEAPLLESLRLEELEVIISAFRVEALGFRVSV